MAEQGFLYDDLVGLVPLEDEHVPTMARWINSMTVTHFLEPLHGMSLSQEQDWLKRLRESATDKVFGIVRRADSLHVGNVGLHGINRVHSRAEYGIMIGEPDCWGQGLGTAAGRLMLDYGFNHLNLQRIFLRVIEFNMRGVKSYENLGFQHEGRMRKHTWKDSNYYDMQFMGLLRDDFNEKWSDWRQDQRKRYGIGGSP